ncbi:MAG: glycoside hydrolase family protein, partial [Lactococcus garvieae]
KVYENAINSYFTRTFNQNQFDAMASFTYNLGAGIFAQDGWEKNASNSYITASFPNYINKGSAFEEGLKKRRQAEVNLFNTPVSGGSETNKGEIEMYLIMTIDTKNWYVSNGVQCKWIKSERFLNNFQNDFGKLNLPVDKMYSTELYKEFPKDTIIVK